MARVKLTPQETRGLARARKLLAAVPGNGSPEQILDAISACVPVAAGTFLAVNDRAKDMLAGRLVRIPLSIHEAWMGTPHEYLSRALAPVLRAKEGDFWVAGELATSVRDNLAVLEELNAHGLGEGAGYKV